MKNISFIVDYVKMTKILQTKKEKDKNMLIY